MPFVDEELADGARAAVHVLVRAPRRPVDIRVVQGEGHIPSRMGEVPQRDGAGTMDGRREPGDVVGLARGVVHPGQERHGEAVSVLVDGRLEIVRRDERFAVLRPDDDEIARRVQAMQPQVRFDGVSVGREGRGVDEDRRPRPGWPEERRQERVQVDGQRVERGHFAGPRADEPGRRLADGVVGPDPRTFPVEPAIDSEAGPGVELSVDLGARRHRLGTQGLTSEIDLRPAVRGDGQEEPLAVGSERVGRVEGEGVGLPERRFGRGHR
jgi:hypothetical protein